jgi:hypothetical protein
MPNLQRLSIRARQALISHFALVIRGEQNPSAAHATV